MNLHSLKNSTKQRKSGRRVGRGISSGLGKTCGRGTKGQGARSGYKRRHGKEGGQFPLFMKLPIRGFSNARFAKNVASINLKDLEKLFQDGEVVNLETLKQRRFFSGKYDALKILGGGELTKKVKVEANALSASAQEKLQKANIEVTIIK